MSKEKVFPNTFTGNRHKISLEKKVRCRYGNEIGKVSIIPEGQELLEHIVEQANCLPSNSFETNTYAEILLLNKNEIIRETSDVMAAFMSVKKDLMEAGISPSMLEILVKKSVNLGSLIGTYNETTDYLEPTSKLRAGTIKKSNGAQKTLEKKNKDRELIKLMVEYIHSHYKDRMPKKKELATVIRRLLGEAVNRHFALSTITTIIKVYCEGQGVSLSRRPESDYPLNNDVYSVLRDKFSKTYIFSFLC